MDDLITKDLVLIELEAEDRDDAISKMIDAIDSCERLADKEKFIADINNREATCSTAIGYGIATPHAKSAGVKQPALVYAKLKKPIEWDPDSDEVDKIFLIGVDKDGADKHLQILASIFRQLVHKKFRTKLEKAKTADDIVKLVVE